MQLRVCHHHVSRAIARIRFSFFPVMMLGMAQLCPAADPYAPIRAASQQRIDAAQKAVKEAKSEAGAAEKRLQSLAIQVVQIANKNGAARDSEAMAARAHVGKAEALVKTLEARLGAMPLDKVTDLKQMGEHDRVVDQKSAAERALDRAESRLQETLNQIAARSEEGATVVAEWKKLSEVVPGLWDKAWIFQGRRDAISRREGGFLQSLAPVKEGEAPAGMTVLKPVVPPPADAGSRRAKFEARNSPESIRSLGKQFFGGMTLTLPGLEKVEQFVKAGRYAEALDAYKYYFFAHLSDEEGSAGSSREEDAATEEGADGESEVDMEGVGGFRPPTPGEIKRAYDGVVVEQVSMKGKPCRVEARLGHPGAMNWVFLSPDLNEQEGDGLALLEFCRAQVMPGRPMSALLHSYALGGSKEDLKRWAEVTDDWCLNWRQDAEAFPVSLRNYNLLCVWNIPAFRGKMKSVKFMRPSVVEDFPAPTLARILMALNEEFLSAAIRLGRSGLYNFRIMALNGMIPNALKMQEFKAQQWALREGWRQVDDNFIYKTRQDGANMEFANDGHENTDQSLFMPFSLIRAWNPQPSFLEPFWADEFIDNFLDNTRYRVHNLKQDGCGYRLSNNSQASRFKGENPEYKVNLLANEDEVRRRMWQVYRVGRPEAPPGILSEGMAYQGYYYLRTGWNPQDDFVYFQCIGQPVLSGREDDCGFSLFGRNQMLLMNPPVVVDGRVQNKHYGLVEWPGGKGNFATYGKPNAVREGRFHASQAFDLVEGKYDGVYQYHRPSKFYDVFGSYGYDSSAKRAAGQAARAGKPFTDDPIRDVKHARQLLSVKGRSLYIVTDRIESEKEHQFTQPITLGAAVRMQDVKKRAQLIMADGKSLVVTDPAAKTIATCAVGVPNIQLHQFGAMQPVYQTMPDERLDQMAKGQAKGKWLKKVRKAPAPDETLEFGPTCRASWSAKGSQVLVTTVSHQDKTYDTSPCKGVLHDVKSLVSSQESAGFTGFFEDGTRITYMAAAKPIHMNIDGLEGVAGTLLLVGNQGIALDCTSLSSGGKPVSVLHPDFEFSLAEGGLAATQPIYRPIKPVVIEPEANVFTASQTVRLSTPTPGVEIRYTLNGERPTPKSTLYAGPFMIDTTCRLKVRAFRKGVTEDIWQQDGTHATAVFSAVFRKEAPTPAVTLGKTEPGLKYEYFEGMWTELMAASLILPAKSSGVSRLLDVGARKTNGAFGYRYDGFIDIPHEGVYTFHAPYEFIYPDIESGYDLRVFVDGQEWYPAVRWHGHGDWSVALAKGKHAFKVVYVEMRKKPHKIEMQWGFPHPDFTWKGVAPVLKMSGPGLEKQVVPEAMLCH